VRDDGLGEQVASREGCLEERELQEEGQLARATHCGRLTPPVTGKFQIDAVEPPTPAFLHIEDARQE